MTRTRDHVTLSLLPLLALFAGACLDPQVSDEVPTKGLVLPAGTAVPSAHDDPEVEAQIASNDGVSGTVPLLSAFADGAPVRYWDFGATPDFIAPVFILADRNANGDLVRLPHNTIIDAIPGDPGYSPYWAVLFLEVTDAYNGELITSFRAIEEAQALGLVYPPLLPTFAVNCPAVASDVAVEVGGGNEALSPPTEFFWKGKTVKSYDFGPMPIADASLAAESSIFVLSREGQAPLSEPLRGVDITGDGDTTDTNNVFSAAKTSENYTPLCRRVNVTVPPLSVPLIDTSGDQLTSAIQDATDLFNPGPVPGNVIAFESTEILGNCPQQSTEGGL